MHPTTLIRNNAPRMWLSALIFAASGLFGYLAASARPDLADELAKGFRNAFEPFLSLSPVALLIFIFLNNTIKSYLAMVGGILFGIAPIVFLYINGFLVGAIFYITAANGHAVSFIAAVLPHGVLEIPAVIVASGFGLVLGARLSRKIFKKRDESLRQALKEAHVVFFQWVLPILAIAAFAEIFITPLFIAIAT